MALGNVRFLSYSLLYEIWFETAVRGHNIYKNVWTPQRDKLLTCKKDDRSEALELDKHAVGVYKNELLVGHVPIELSRLIFQFLECAETNVVNVLK